jgi:hypothetical protein
MADIPDIPDYGEPPSNYRSTSRKSAKKFSINFGTKCYKIHEYIKSKGANGAAAFEIERDLGLTIGGVCSTLHREDYVRSKDNDERYERKNPDTNHDQLIWYAKEFVDPEFGKHEEFEYLMVSCMAANRIEEWALAEHKTKEDIVDDLVSGTKRSTEDQEFLSLSVEDKQKMMKIYKYLKIGKIEFKMKA